MHPEQLQQIPSLDDYEAQLRTKHARLEAILQNHVPGIDDIYHSSPCSYRMRAEFRVWHDGEELNYVMFPKGQPNSPVRIQKFTPGSDLMQELMPKVMSHAQNNPVLRQRLFQIDFLTTTSGQCLVSMLYHRKLDDTWLNEAKQLESQLKIAVIGRSRKQKLICSQDYLVESVNVAGRTLHYKQYENSFTQPNAGINAQMLNWAHTQTLSSEGDLLELYCGNGNFSLALAPNFNRVLATEVDKFGIRAANYNVDTNGVDNVQLVRMSAAEVSSALTGEREFRRLKHINLQDYQFTTVLVDPPRAGLDKQALSFIATFDRIVYISCNPATLEENLRSLAQTHAVVTAALFDQFPFTDHIESGVVLQKR